METKGTKCVVDLETKLNYYHFYLKEYNMTSYGVTIR